MDIMRRKEGTQCGRKLWEKVKGHYFLSDTNFVLASFELFVVANFFCCVSSLYVVATLPQLS